MIDIHLDSRAQIPLYKQIVEQIRQLIATNHLQPGEHLPTVRQLAQTLQINPGTVSRAYLELEQDRIIVSRRGGGTIVVDRTNDPLAQIRRQRQLSSIVSSNILETLSLGYNPEELEAAFYLHLARWREERKESAEPYHSKTEITAENTIRIVGSHDMALNLLIGQLQQKNPEINVNAINSGSLGGLIALQEDRADLAGIHLLDEETGEYNYPYIKHILTGREVAVIHLAYRIQGLMFIKENPRQIKGLDDLSRPDVRFINRQKGSGTRILLDMELRQHGISPSTIKGYDLELDTHIAVATSISKGEADVGLGIEAAAHTYDLDFLPLFRERYDIVIPMVIYQSKIIKPILEIIDSAEFKRTVISAGGYDTSQTGNTTFLK